VCTYRREGSIVDIPTLPGPGVDDQQARIIALDSGVPEFSVTVQTMRAGVHAVHVVAPDSATARAHLEGECEGGACHCPPDWSCELKPDQCQGTVDPGSLLTHESIGKQLPPTQSRTNTLRVFQLVAAWSCAIACRRASDRPVSHAPVARAGIERSRQIEAAAHAAPRGCAGTHGPGQRLDGGDLPFGDPRGGSWPVGSHSQSRHDARDALHEHRVAASAANSQYPAWSINSSTSSGIHRSSR
jgi:hypothetical protein